MNITRNEISFERFKSEIGKYHYINTKYPQITLNGDKIMEQYPTCTKTHVFGTRDITYTLH